MSTSRPDVARDDEAFTAFYARHVVSVSKCVTAILRQAQDVQDVIQEVFVHAWIQMDKYEESRGTMTTWLTTIARNRAIDRLRALQRSTANIARAGLEREKPRRDLTGEWVIADQALALRRFASALSAEQQRLLEMAYDDELSHSSIAALLHQPLGTVKTKLRQTLKILRNEAGRHRAAIPQRQHRPESPAVLPFTVESAEKIRTHPLGEAAIQHRQIDHRLRGLRILVLDDDSETLCLTSAVLGRFGAIASPHIAAESALNQLRMEWADFMVVDLEMPGQDGYAFLSAAKAIAIPPGKSFPPSAAFTASVSEYERSSVLLAGFDAYLPKPVHPLALLALVASFSVQTMV